MSRKFSVRTWLTDIEVECELAETKETQFVIKRVGTCLLPITSYYYEEFKPWLQWKLYLSVLSKTFGVFKTICTTIKSIEEVLTYSLKISFNQTWNYKSKKYLFAI